MTEIEATRPWTRCWRCELAGPRTTGRPAMLADTSSRRSWLTVTKPQGESTLTNESANRIVEDRIRDRLTAMEEALESDVVMYAGPIQDPAPDILKQVMGRIEDKQEKLTIVLETSGGHIEVAERIANIFRHHYSVVNFLVGTYAMSAGTVLALSGDDVLMDYASTLGPIDPQVMPPNGDRFVPALGYLEQYDRLVKKSHEGTLSSIEAAYFLQSFDPAEMSLYAHARELSIALLEEWLATYKFRNWHRTETQDVAVTLEMKRERAKEIAVALNDTSHWHSHSRGITMSKLRDLKLKVDDIDDNPDLRSAFNDYWTLIREYRVKLGHNSTSVNWQGGYLGF